MADRAARPVRALFLCHHNAARPQPAGAFPRRNRGDRFEVISAGADQADRVRPPSVAAQAGWGRPLVARCTGSYIRGVPRWR